MIAEALLLSAFVGAEPVARECVITRIGGQYADVQCEEVSLELINRCAPDVATVGDRVFLDAIDDRPLYTDGAVGCYELIGGEAFGK